MTETEILGMIREDIERQRQTAEKIMSEQTELRERIKAVETFQETIKDDVKVVKERFSWLSGVVIVSVLGGVSSIVVQWMTAGWIQP